VSMFRCKECGGATTRVFRPCRECVRLGVPEHDKFIEVPESECEPDHPGDKTP